MEVSSHASPSESNTGPVIARAVPRDNEHSSLMSPVQVAYQVHSDDRSSISLPTVSDLSDDGVVNVEGVHTELKSFSTASPRRK